MEDGELIVRRGIGRLTTTGAGLFHSEETLTWLAKRLEKALREART